MGMKLKMKDRLDEAMKLAKEEDSWVELVSIVGIRLHRDGAVHFGGKDDYVSRWQYAFVKDRGDAGPPKWVTVLYWMNGEKPHIDPNAGNCSDTIPFEEDIIQRLEDSPELTTIFHQQPDFKPMGGYDGDVIIYKMERPMAPMAIIQNWKGQGLMIDPVTLEKI